MRQSFDPKNILLLHASAVSNADGALLFLGPSGTGKSTMWRMLSAYMSPVAEDAVCLVHQEDEWRVVSGGHCKRGDAAEMVVEGDAVSYIPLRAVCRLYQAAEPQLEKMDTLLTCRYLTDAFFEIYPQRGRPLEVKQHTFMNLAGIARALVGYIFHFGLSSRTPEVLNLEMGLW